MAGYLLQFVNCNLTGLIVGEFGVEIDLLVQLETLVGQLEDSR